MPVTRPHGLYPIKIHSDGMSEHILRGITRLSINTGTEVVQEAHSGDVYAGFQAIYSQSPGASFETLHVAAALETCGLTGLRITSAVNPGLVLYAQKRAEGGTRESGSSHRSYTFREGLLVPRRLTCEHQRDARISYDFLATYDGTNTPIVVADSVSLPSATEAEERFTLGPCTIGGKTLEGKRRFEIDFGNSASVVSADSDVWPTFVSIDENVSPTLILSGIDPLWMSSSNLPLNGLIADHDDTLIFLRKRASGGTFVADEEDQHIAFTGHGLAYVETPLDVSGNAIGETTIRVPLKFDGTNVPLVIDTTAAIAEQT